MDVRHIDHVNLRVPEDAIPDARAFYEEALGFPLEGVDRFTAGEKPFFDVRLAPTHVVHLWPTAEFAAPTATNYDHLALVVEQSVAEVTAALEDAGVEIEQELDAPRGATGEAGAVYVRDPFGYRVELKEPVESAG